MSDEAKIDSRWSTETENLITEMIRFGRVEPQPSWGLARDILTALANAGLLAALSAPSEPVPDGPRVWASPTIPTDVKAVLDGEGDQWKRNAKGRWNVQTPPNVPANTTGGYTDNELIDFYGPLTEVVEESTP